MSASYQSNFLPNTYQRQVHFQLAKDFTEFHSRGGLCDAYLVFPNENHIRLAVHKAILAARSPVFYAMFSDNTIEAKSNQVEITDMTIDVVDQLLTYIYTGKLDKLDEYALDLMTAADKVYDQ